MRYSLPLDASPGAHYCYAVTPLSKPKVLKDKVIRLPLEVKLSPKVTDEVF